MAGKSKEQQPAEKKGEVSAITVKRDKKLRSSAGHLEM